MQTSTTEAREDDAETQPRCRLQSIFHSIAVITLFEVQYTVDRMGRAIDV